MTLVFIGAINDDHLATAVVEFIKKTHTTTCLLLCEDYCAEIFISHSTCRKYYTKIFINPNCSKSRVGYWMNDDAIMKEIAIKSARCDRLKHVH